MEGSVDQAFESSDEASDVINQAFASAGFSNASTLARAVALGTALVDSVRAAAAENRRFTELLQPERFDCSGDFTWETCVPWLIRFANPGRAIPRSRPWMQWPPAVLCDRALTLSFLMKKTLTQQILVQLLLKSIPQRCPHTIQPLGHPGSARGIPSDGFEAVLGQFNVYLDLSG